MVPQTTDALAALRDIHLPEAVSLWPLAPGWWVALAIATTLVAALLMWWRRRRNSARRAALVLLDAAAQRFRDDSDPRVLAVALSNLLRRVALKHFPRRDVASLYGEGWLDFLRENSRRAQFPAEVLHALEHCLYGRPDSVDRATGEAWLDATGSWIRRVT